MLVVGEHAGRHISDFSGQFQSEFVTLLSRRFGTKRVHANRVYQEYIQDKHHLHMNATRWVTLSEFAKHLGRTGVARVDETEKGWFLAWIDNSPKALAKAEASQKKERATTSDEQRERMLIADQIERAAQEAGDVPHETEKPKVDEGLKRDESSEKVVLSFSVKPTTQSAEPTTASLSGLKFNPLKASSSNPLKRPNVFKAAASIKNEKGKDAPEKVNGKRTAPMAAAERLIYEDQERKRRKMEHDGRGVMAV